MASRDRLFDGLGLRGWCDGRDGTAGGPMTMDQLLARTRGEDPAEAAAPGLPFPSLDALDAACGEVPRTREVTSGVERLFLDVKDGLKVVLDPLTQPLTQPLSWLLDAALYGFTAAPWWIVIPALIGLTWAVSRAAGVTAPVAGSLLFLAFIDHYDAAIQTLSIIVVCTGLCVALGVPIGIAMSRSNAVRRAAIPVLDLLQTMPSFVYLIPLTFLFSVTESKLYGIAIILHAIVPVIRLTDLGIRLADRDVIEAADAFGMTARQKLWGVQVPLALPTIMAGVNQTIMMSLAMVVIASLVSAPGLGALVLRGIRNLELGVGLVAGFGIVLLAVILDRASKAALARVDVSRDA